MRAEITITDTEVVQKARDGKLSGWSFGFIANDDEISTEGKDEIRTVTDMELLEVSILDETKAPAYYGTSIETREGGARMKEIRADTFERNDEQTTEQTEKPTISIEELANLVAAKVIEALKTEEKAEGEEQSEETTEETEEQTEETAETEETEEAEAEDEETEEQESRSIDYSAFEDRLAKLMK